MNLTYKQLEDIIKGMTERQKNMNVSVYAQGEFYPVDVVSFTTYNDVLDEDHPIINIVE